MFRRVFVNRECHSTRPSSRYQLKVASTSRASWTTVGVGVGVGVEVGPGVGVDDGIAVAVGGFGVAVGGSVVDVGGVGVSVTEVGVGVTDATTVAISSRSPQAAAVRPNRMNTAAVAMVNAPRRVYT